MTSMRPYLIRAIYEWIEDNNCTPHMLVNAHTEGAVLPTQYVQDGRIVLNIRAKAVQGLELGDEFILFNARFSGQPMEVYFPVSSVLAIYAKESGKGMVFDQDSDTNNTTPPPSSPPPPKKKSSKPPVLTVVK